MKKAAFFFLVAAGGFALAQTNVFAPKNLPHTPTEISSDSADFDLNIRRGIYRGHVSVVDPKVKMTCEWLVVDLPASGGHLSHVSAETNVVIDFIDEKGLTNHVTSAKVVYAYSEQGSVTNETVTWTGNPVVETPDMTILSEPLVWDRMANKFYFTNDKMIPRHNFNAGNGTNASPLKLF
jgi:lipopolysaccharide export system protein LptA